MDIKSMLSFDEKEKKILKLVFFVSLGVCIGAVGIAWGVQKISLNSSTSKSALDTDPSDLSARFENKRKELINEDLLAHQFAANYYERMNQPQKAIMHLLRLLSVDPDNRLFRKQLAEAYLKSGKYDKALVIFSELHDEKEQDSLSRPIMALYGLALFHTGHVEQSLTVLDAVIDKYPDFSKAWCYRGQVEAAINSSSDSAESYFAKALELEPNYAEALYQWARFSMNKPHNTKADRDSARIRLLKLLQIEPLNPKAHARLGMIYYYLGQFEIAEKSYQTALALNPDDYNTHYNLGELYCSMYWNNEEIDENDKHQLRKKALMEFKETIKIDSAHALAPFKIGIISLENNMLNEAILYFERARKLAPKNIRLLLQLGVAYEKKNMPTEALSVYNTVLDYDPVNQVAQQKVKLLAGQRG